MSWPASDLQHGSGIREAYSRAALRRVNVGKDSAYRGCAFRLRRVIAFTSIDVLAGCLFLQFISLSRPPGALVASRFTDPESRALDVSALCQRPSEAADWEALAALWLPWSLTSRPALPLSGRAGFLPLE